MAEASQLPRSADRFFWEGVEAGKLLLQRCSECGSFRQPPRPMCPKCQSLEWEAVESTGRGTVVSYVIQRLLVPEGQEQAAVLVELEEGVRLVSGMVGIDPRATEFGMPVQVEFTERLGVQVPVFRPAAGDAP